jgi:Na+-driven multidrug efflux pump
MIEDTTTAPAKPAPGAEIGHGRSADAVRVVLGMIALEVVMIGLAVLWVAIYSHLLAPGLTADEYGEYAKHSSPMVALVAGPPVFYAAGLVAARRGGARAARLALASTISYVALDVLLVALLGEGRAFAWLVLGIAVPTKLVAVVLGGRHGRAGLHAQP